MEAQRTLMRQLILGMNQGVIAKLHNELAIDYLELSTCVAHSFVLVGVQACYKSKISNIFFCYIKSYILQCSIYCR